MLVRRSLRRCLAGALLSTAKDALGTSERHARQNWWFFVVSFAAAAGIPSAREPDRSVPMTRHLLLSLCAIGVLSGFVVTPVVSAQQSVNFNLGAFNLTGNTTDLTDRGVDDVFFQNADFLGFDFDDFNGVTIGGEYL